MFETRSNPQLLLRLREMRKLSKRFRFSPRVFFVYFPLCAGISVFLISLVQIFFWTSSEESLRSLAGQNMKFNSAIGLHLGALSILGLFLALRFPSLDRLRWVAISLAPLIFLLGVVTGIQYIFSIDLQIDQFFVKDILLGEGMSFPGRMSPQNSLCFTFLGSTLFLLGWKGRGSLLIEQVIIAPALIVAALALIGYAYKYPGLYQFYDYHRMSEWSALALLTLSVSVYCLKPKEGLVGQLADEEMTGAIARRLMLAAVFVPFFVGWLRIHLEVKGYLFGIAATSAHVMGNMLAFSALIYFTLRTLKRVDEERSQALLALRMNQERTNFLSESSKLLSSTLDFEITTNNLAELAVTQVCDWCVIDLLGSSGQFHRYTAIHRDPNKKQLMEQLKDLPPLLAQDEMLRQAIETRETILFRSVDLEEIERMMPDPKRRKLWVDIGVQSGVLVPLHARGRVIGLMSFVKSDNRYSYGPEDIPLLEEFARRASYAIDNSILYSESQDAIKLRDEFFSIASHELKTPISSLSLHLQLMRRMLRRAVSIEELQNVLSGKMKDLESQLKRLTGLIENLLDVSRLRSGKISLAVEKFNFAELLRDLIHRVQPMARHRGMTIELRDCAEVVGYWDRFRLEQVVNNLLTNAIKYGDAKPVYVSLTQDGDFLELKVADQGRGIPQADHDRIFDRFERSDHNSQISGLGLGLYIVDQFVKSHFGEVRVHSEPNNGATFFVRLPIAESPDFYTKKRGSAYGKQESEPKVADSSG